MGQPPTDAETVVVPQQGPAQDDHTVFGAEAAPAPAQSPDSGVPARVDRYVIEGVLGSGGMGMVLRGRDPQLDRPVAVKLIHTRRYRSTRDDQQARLVREAQALAALSHPNVVEVYEVGTHQRSVFLAMELVEGLTLQTWAKQRAQGWADIVRMYVQAGRGLEAAHQRGLVHRDFKPANVLVGDDGRVRVLDFGLATLDEHHSSIGDTSTTEASGGRPRFDALSAGLTAASTVMGTPAYMAPEQHSGDPVTAAADQFSFCVSLWWQLVGEPPYPGRTLEEIRAALTSGTRNRVPPELPVPRRVLTLLERGLELLPEARWPTLGALLDRLDAVVQPRRRGWAWALGGGALVAGGLAVALWPEPEPRCNPHDQPGGVPWGDRDRAALRAVFERSDQPAVKAAWDSVVEVLDERTGAWVAGYAEVCEGGIVAAGDQATFDLRMGCLYQRRDAIRAVLDVLATGQDEQRSHAMDVVGKLRPAAGCVEVQPGDPATALPREPEAAREATELRAELVGAEALIDSGRREEGEARAGAVLERATALGFGPVQAEAELRHGVALSRLGQTQRAEPVLDRAFWRASDLDYPKVGAEAAIELAWQVGYLQGRHDEGIEWVRHYESMTRRLGDDPKSNVAAVLGPIYFDAQRFEQAQPYLERQLQRELKIDPASHDVAVARMNLATLLLETGDLARADEQFRLSQEGVERLFPQGHPDLALTLINRATVIRGYREDYDQAERLLRRGIEQSTELNGAEHPTTALGLMNLGSLHIAQERYDEAIETLQTSLRHYGDGSITEKLHVRYELGEALLGAGRTEEAERMLQQTLATAQDELPADHLIIAAARAGLARVAHGRGQADEAQRRFEEAIAAIAVTLPLEAHDLQLELAALQLERGEIERARARVEQAHAWAHQTHRADHPAALDAQLALAQVAARAGEAGRARQILGALIERGPQPPVGPYRFREAQALLKSLP